MKKYNRNINELKKQATLWWPEELKKKNALSNVLPLLIKTQDDFLSLLNLSKKDPFQQKHTGKIFRYRFLFEPS